MQILYVLVAIVILIIIVFFIVVWRFCRKWMVPPINHHPKKQPKISMSNLDFISFIPQTSSLPLHVYRYPTIIEAKNNTGIIVNIAPYSGYYELVLYSEDGKTILHVIPYLQQAQIKVPDQLKPGKYLFTIRTSSDKPPQGLIQEGNVNSFHITQSNQFIPYPDQDRYDSLGEVFVKNRNRVENQGYKLSGWQISKDSSTIEYRKETCSLNLKPTQKALVIIPSRTKTINPLIHEVIQFNDKTADLNPPTDTFFTYEIDGSENTTLEINQYIFGMLNNYKILPFYIYKFDPI
jgi:hypothetical protein